MTLSSLQPDLVQRYRLIGAILAELQPASPGGRLRVLDLGAGAESLVEAVMPPWCDLHRADVDTFGRHDITRLVPGGPLPFPDADFDVVLALEVLEHLPVADRPLFLDECLRVSSRAVILSTPLGTGTTRHLEDVFRRAAEQVSGTTIPFLDEHAAYGLPDPELTALALARRGAEVVTLDNAPAAEWLLGNIVDFLYSARFGEGEEKAAQNIAQNRVLPTARVGTAHYRRVFCASRHPADLMVLQTLRERQTIEAPPLTPEALAEFAVDRLACVVRDLEVRRVQQLEIKESRVAQLEQHVAGMDEALSGLRGGLELQQQHITKMEAALSAQIEATGAAEAGAARAAADAETARAEIDALRTQARAEEVERLDEARRRAAAIDEERCQRAAAEVERLRLQLLALQDAEADEQRRRGQLERQVGLAKLQLLRTGQELTAMRRSTTWRATAPLRRAVSSTRSLRVHAAVQWRRFRQRGKPLGAWPAGLSRNLLAASGLFDPAWYLSTYEDVAAAGLDPLAHFLSSGAGEGRRPTPLFDTAYYLNRYPDVGTCRLNPLVHYVLYGGREGRWVNAAFDSGYYLRTYPDVAASRLTPLAHYIRFGAAEGRHPSAEFDPGYYLETNPDVRAAGLGPLEHYVLAGAHEGRVSRKMSVAHAAPAHGGTAARGTNGYVPPPGLLPWFSPLNTVLDPALAARPRLNVLVPGLGMRHMSGGPNTVLAFVGRLAAHGIPLRLVSTDAPVDDDPASFWAHLTALAGGTLAPDIELLDAHDRAKPFCIGEYDLFLASAWWTAQQVKYAIRLTRTQRFVYFIQDYEPLLHAASTPQALAEETYALDYVPVINTRVLADFFAERRIGRFAAPGFADDAVVFEPALDRALFHPAPRAAKPTRRLLFYARPTNGLRNLFELAVAALQQAIAEGVLPPDRWEFLGMGEAFAPVDLGHGAVLRPAPWLGLQGYAEQMRESDVLLSLMLSPHPSYPPLEMAACGGVAVTTVYANKDAARLATMSPRILGVPATIEGLVSGLARAVTMPAAEETSGGRIALPQSWDEAFNDVVPQVATRVRALMGLPVIAAVDGTPSGTFPGYHWPRQAYDVQRLQALERRRHEYRSPSDPLLFSIITPVWNTDPVFLDELCLSVLRQDCAPGLFEWVVVDNASTRGETRAVLDRWAATDARLRIHRADQNLGILGGLRACLERARGRYIVTVDHDDLLTPDALRVLGCTLAARGYPLVAYSDEDKIDGVQLRDPYLKPDWDPVLFAHSCYTSHVGVLDRQRALDLGAYTDPGTEGSHDWDSFVRFWGAGIAPVHVPEVLYTWRMHAESTAGNIHSKPYVFDSQRRVLEKFVEAARPAVPCQVVPSALFPGTPDWRLLTEREPRIITAVFGPLTAPEPRVAGAAPRSSHAVSSLEALAGVARQAVEQGSLLHLVCRGVDIDEETWAREAASLLALFPDTSVVGGPLLHKGRVIDGARIAGVGQGLEAVDLGRYAHDPGYFAQAWKPHTVDAVPAGHVVVEPSFLLDVIERLPPALLESPSRVGPWLSAAARVRGRRVVYSPYLRAVLTSVSIGETWDSGGLGAVLAFGDLGDRALWSPHLSLSMIAGLALRDPAVEPRALAAPDLFVESYAAWLEADRVARRLTRPRSNGPRPTVAVLTSVWTRTPAKLFAETIDCVLRQTTPPDEWIILRNGPVGADVAAEIARVAAAPFVRMIDVADNVGIIGAMRVCLAAATTNYVLPLDADDVLEDDALEMLVAWAASGNADLVFSDEDHLANGALDHPFFRPGFDAVLHAESAYIWHACLVRREQALAVGTYQDAGAEYCHDWDTICRLTAARGHIVHVPHLLYHWRTHASSHSNSGQQHPGTLASTRHVIEQMIARTSNPDRYRVATYPRDRGVQEFYVERIPADSAAGLFIRVADAGVPASGTSGLDIPVPVITIQGGEALGVLLDAAIAALRDDAIVHLASDHITAVGAAGFWDAVKMFELHASVGVVGGRVLDPSGVVSEAGRVYIDQGAWMDPFAGRPAADPGPFALALKAHRIDRPAAGLMAVRVTLLRDLIARADIASLDDLADACAAACLARGAWIAYTPLLQGIRDQPAAVRQAPVLDVRRLRAHATRLGYAGPLPVRHGAAALAVYRMRRRLV